MGRNRKQIHDIATNHGKNGLTLESTSLYFLTIDDNTIEQSKTSSAFFIAQRITLHTLQSTKALMCMLAHTVSRLVLVV